MRIVQSDRLVKADNSFFLPWNRYVVSDFECDMLIQSCPSTNWRWSSFNAHERRYAGQDLKGKKVCVYRHNAWGDQLIVSAIPAELKRRFPGATVHLYCHSDVHSLWEGNPNVGGMALPLPMPFDAVRCYDYTIFYEGILESNREPDQKNCYDDMFEMIGLMDVLSPHKRPNVMPLAKDYEITRTLGIAGTKYILYHMSPANNNRRYPPELSRKLLRLMAKAFPEYTILVVGVDPKGEYTQILRGIAKNVRNLLSKAGPFRNMIPIIEGAKCLVCPDSSLMHLAACFPHVPVVSLWGLFDPEDRAKYYTNVLPHALTAFTTCPHAPCRDHNFFLPTEQCKDALRAGYTGDIKHCVALESITPERILREVKVCVSLTDQQVSG